MLVPIVVSGGGWFFSFAFPFRLSGPFLEAWESLWPTFFGIGATQTADYPQMLSCGGANLSLQETRASTLGYSRKELQTPGVYLQQGSLKRHGSAVYTPLVVLSGSTFRVC